MIIRVFWHLIPPSSLVFRLIHMASSVQPVKQQGMLPAATNRTIINGLLRSSLRWWQHHHQNQNQRQNDWCHLVSLITAALIPLSGERLCKSNSKIILQTAQHCSHHNKNNNKQKTRIANRDLKMHLHGNEGTVDSQKTVEHQEVAVHHKASISWQEYVKYQG